MEIDMNQEERLNYLVEGFKEDSVRYRDMEVSEDQEERRKVLRSLMNIRIPGEMDREVLRCRTSIFASGPKRRGS